MTECRGLIVITSKTEIQCSDYFHIIWAFWITRKLNICYIEYRASRIEHLESIREELTMKINAMFSNPELR